MPLDSQMQCLCCNRAVLVDSVAWGQMEMPIVTCPTCTKTVPRAIVSVLFILRSQVATLGNEVVHLKRDISRLFTAQQDLEQALVAEAETE